ncbi:MAG: hypothetical protein AAF773_12360 [Cyanobacteria bacterium P01_D01_bin.115]
MPEFPPTPVTEVRRRLLARMVSFMEGDENEPESECGYTQADINQCASIIDAYLADIAANTEAGDDQLRLAIQQVVLQLNDLNDSCDGWLIETDEREDLCQIILVAAQECGLTTTEDVTEEWRDW